MHTTGWLMEWAVEENLVKGLFYHATLTSRKRQYLNCVSCKQERKYATLVRRRFLAEPSRECGCQCRGWKYGVSQCSPTWVIRQSSAPLLLSSSDELMCYWAGVKNGYLDLTCRAFPHGERVSAVWIRCPDSMARCARDRVAPLRRSSVSCMPARAGRVSAGVECRCEHYSTRQERSTPLLNELGLRWLFATLLLQHPSSSHQAAWECDAWCQLFAKWVEVQRYVSENLQKSTRKRLGGAVTSQSSVYVPCMRKFEGKNRTKTFRVCLGKFGEKSFALPAICLFIHLWSR